MPKNCRHCGAENKIQAIDCVRCSKNLSGSIQPEPSQTGQPESGGIGCVIVALVIIIGAISVTCSRGSGSAEGNDVSETTHTADTAYVPVEEKLAVIGGNSADESKFAVILDRLQAGTDICTPEPSRDHAADVITAGWMSSGQSSSLLEFAQTLLDACS